MCRTIHGDKQARAGTEWEEFIQRDIMPLPALYRPQPLGYQRPFMFLEASSPRE
ncbi:Hypothetical protein FKW44_004802 [Caligus rogercresseyi]|uniref:Uncharacterized protein n=1 Tax=Caligus rogercresseyi TaxID=217165 RepID=A0A7T8HME3_CALRO|nr:Hypothetical protein FKW44_004802 [Caligus rogercresseyi]